MTFTVAGCSECGHPRKLRFINRKRCAVDLYMRKLQLSHKITDLLGFVISMEEYLEEDKVRHAQFAVMQQRDLEWVQYLKNIGGPENLKPAGVYKVRLFW